MATGSDYAWIGGILAALYDVGSGIADRVGGGGGSGKNTLQTKRIPLPANQQAMQDYMLRVAAANVNKPLPSFGDFMDSGGTARFSLDNATMTPSEAMALGFTSNHGTDIPYYDQGQNGVLTEEQKLFAGQRDIDRGKKNTPLAKLRQAKSNMGQASARLARATTDRDKIRFENAAASAAVKYRNLLGQVDRGGSR